MYSLLAEDPSVELGAESEPPENDYTSLRICVIHLYELLGFEIPLVYISKPCI